MTPERARKIRQVLCRRQPDLTVVTDDVHKGRNLAAILRTCDAVGVMVVHAATPPGSAQRAWRGTAMGSQRWVDTRRYPAVEEPLQALLGQGFQVVAAHPAAGAVDYREIDYTRPTAVLLGAEKWGLGENALRLAGQRVVIPMLGMVASFNVSVAAAIILAEARHQRERAGMYADCRLPSAEYQRLFFRWGYERLADWCDRHGAPYPTLDEAGNIVDPDGAWRRLLKSFEAV